MVDSSINSNGNALAYYKEKLSVHLSDKFTITSSNGSIPYDKEMLKRTMLVHESTFRKQVYELHHLYKIQTELMAQFKREEFNSCPRHANALQTKSSASQVVLEDVKGVRQAATPFCGHDFKQSSIDLVNESSSQYKVSGVLLRHNNVRSQKKMLDLQLPAEMYANDDDEVKILEVRPSKSLPWASGSVFGGNVNLNLENSVGSSHVGKSWITDIQNQHYTSQGVNRLPGLEGKLKEKCVGKISGSRFIGSNEDTRHSNSSRQRKDDSNASMAWYTQNCIGSSMGHCLPSACAFNYLTFTPPNFNHALNPPCENNNASYLTKSHYSIAEDSSSISMDSTPKAPYNHSLKIHEEAQYPKLSSLHHNLKGIDLNDTPVDTSATWEQGSEKSVVDISWLTKKPVSLMKSEVSSTYAGDHSHILCSPTLYSESIIPTRPPSFPINGSKEDSQCSPTLQYDLNIGPSIKCEVDMEMQPQRKETDVELQRQRKKADTYIRNLIDLNEALPNMDDPEMDACESSKLVPHEPDDPSRDSLVITTTESLVAMCNVVVQQASPKPDMEMQPRSKEANVEMQRKRKEAGTDIRNLIDLNEALPIMDDIEMDACESSKLVPHEFDDPSRDSLAITTAESPVAMCNVVVQQASPELDKEIQPQRRKADVEMQRQRKEADIYIRNLIDLNEALPVMDDPEIDACESSKRVPNKLDDYNNSRVSSSNV